MLVSEAAKQLKMNTQTLRLGLQQNKFPFGTAILTSPKRFTYYVNEKRLKQYMEGCDVNNEMEEANCCGVISNTTGRLH